MKRVRRISVRIDRRELTISLTRTVGARETPGGERGRTRGVDAAPRPPVCPDCGSAWIDVAAPRGGQPAFNATRLSNALREQGAHVHLSATGEFRFCVKSFEEIRLRQDREKL